ncbi:MAG: hypothetical protein E7606_05595 [Ruminococcaceae bacterium]|nr:hypothetical protein [Oscillospiraceae bacterium]
MNNAQFTRPQAIRNLQRYLRQLSYFDESIPPPPLTGTWDARTEESLAAFQKNNRLPETGRADDVTWNLLYDEYRRSVDQGSPPRTVPFFPRLPFGYEIAEGEESFAVSAIQYMLGEITLHYDNIEGPKQTGIYGEDTANAIREFQMRNLLPITGKVNKTTWDFLVRAYEIVFEDYEQ